MTFYNLSKIITFTCVLVWKILLCLSLAFMSKIQHSFLFKVLSPTNFKSMENEHGQAPEYTVTLWSQSHWVNPADFHHIWENFKIFLMLFPQDTIQLQICPLMTSFTVFSHFLFPLCFWTFILSNILLLRNWLTVDFW